MSTDRELLELAAKAAGIDVRLRYCEAWNGMALYTPQDGYFGPTWNPLTDDGDALRLSVKLRIDICRPCDDSPIICSWDGGDFCEEHFGANPYAATRRAIVRAAAEIGKSK